jgi:TMEM175 potassium channel family protein
MNQPFHNELKKEFQLERMILFSDAVFAIAITILVIEIKVPQYDRHTVTDNQLSAALRELIPKFVGFLISFFIIGGYWMMHHRMFGYVVNYTFKLLWLNIIFLLAVVLMPLSTEFYNEYVTSRLTTPAVVYVINIVFLGTMSLILWKYITNPKLKLVEGITKEAKRYFILRALTIPSVFIVMAIVYLTVDRKYAVWIPLLIPVIMKIFRRLYFKTK